ncbi:haloacid dehalogenase-like hydrolase, putative [Synechococcus sp. PCC 7335]|uniref:HAD family hydrolase n=1 Tax=Synechococcus sp. (strain ATCC 29403 / PCC 7335) TaxID=91464 RepID=UPI00017ED1D6|nr:HAD family phosphatase [Synechococcus sp. PCC 7335]EDX85664.1 haloacid dehalogenase-like hydrolase, putative [Synechococcus sp. PCC 7335]
MLKAVIFDLDGTLTDSDKVHFQVFQELFAERDIEIDKALYRERISGRQNSAIVSDFFPDMSEEEGEAFSDNKEALFRKRAKGSLEPLSGLTDFLAAIQKHELAAAVVTNAPPKNAWFMLDTIGLSEQFDPVIIADELPRGKPDPLPYQTALNKLGIKPEEAIVFEDSTAGIRSAVGAKITTIGVMTTHSETGLISVGAQRVIADFSDPYLQTLFQPSSPLSI